jgi:hypothetical protein
MQGALDAHEGAWTALTKIWMGGDAESIDAQNAPAS